jgi:hypothetical protein
LCQQTLATGEPEGPLWRADEYAADNPNAPRINATILSLVRNSELEGMLQSMRDLERTWNSKFNYPWTFMNDEDFTEEFKRRTRAETKAECRYGMSVLSYSTNSERGQGGGARQRGGEERRREGTHYH